MPTPNEPPADWTLVGVIDPPAGAAGPVVTRRIGCAGPPREERGEPGGASDLPCGACGARPTLVWRWEIEVLEGWPSDWERTTGTCEVRCPRCGKHSRYAVERHER